MSPALAAGGWTFGSRTGILPEVGRALNLRALQANAASTAFLQRSAGPISLPAAVE